MPHSFSITIKIGYKTKNIKVEYIPVDDRVEHFKLYGNTVITLESNRPFFRKKGIKKRLPDYKIVDGHVPYSNTLDPFIEQINEYFEKNVTVKFKHEGRDVYGVLCMGSGVGSSGTYHLMVDGFYWGQLVYSENFGWQFSSNVDPNLKKLNAYFGRAVTKG